MRIQGIDLSILDDCKDFVTYQFVSRTLGKCLSRNKKAEKSANSIKFSWMLEKTIKHVQFPWTARARIENLLQLIPTKMCLAFLLLRSIWERNMQAV